MKVETVGYAERIKSSTESPNWRIEIYTSQSLLIMFAPALSAVSMYMALARIIRLTDGECHCLIKAKQLTRWFVVIDIYSLIMQALGTFQSHETYLPDVTASY